MFLCMFATAVITQVRREAPAEPFGSCLLAARRPTLLHKADAQHTFIELTVVWACPAAGTSLEANASTRAEVRRVAPPQDGVLLLRPALPLHHIGTPGLSPRLRMRLRMKPHFFISWCSTASSWLSAYLQHPSFQKRPRPRLECMSGFATFRFKSPVQDSSIRFLFVIRQYSTELNGTGPEVQRQRLQSAPS